MTFGSRRIWFATVTLFQTRKEALTATNNKVGRSTPSSLVATAAMNVVVLEEGVAMDKEEPAGQRIFFTHTACHRNTFCSTRTVNMALPSSESSNKLEMVDSQSEDTGKETEIADPAKGRTVRGQHNSFFRISFIAGTFRVKNHGIAWW